jgi:RND superfamily putative drug exporter
MILVFGGFLAASLPVIGAVASIVLGLGSLLALTYATDVESFVVNVVTVLGLGLSIDYGLLVVSRFREEVALMRAADDGARIAKGDPRIAQAVRTTVATSGVLTIISLGAVAVILLAVVAAATLTPALLMLWGHILARGSALERIPGLGGAIRAVSDNSTEEGVFSALARRVHRRPWWVMGGVAVVLVVLALPLTHLTLRASTFEMVPDDTDTGRALAEVSASYPALDYGDVLVVTDAPAGDVSELVAEIGAVDGVATVRDPAPPRRGADAARRRPRHRRPGYETWVGGRAGSQIDFTDALVDGFPPTALVVAVAVFVLLFLMTGSLLVPLKALVINSLSIAASLGLTTWLLTTTTGSGLIGLDEPHGGLETYVVALIVAFGFGLAMDYEVFLLARIKEYWDRTRDNDLAVERGLQRSGRIITSAALIIIAVFLGFALGEVAAIQQVGIGLALTVLIDATLVRMLLVPATMTLLGRWNWWAPPALRRVHESFAIRH